jgi:calcineurin-like phosphoesterase family protein
MTIWFTSDHHFGHGNIIKYCNRPFSNTHEMNLAMETAWNRIVQPEDMVYYLGDFAMNVRLVPLLAHRLAGKKILIPGNHDKCWKKQESTRWHSHYLEAGFEEITQELHLDIAGETVLLNHLPYRNERDPSQKYFADRPVDNGGWLIHGHVHQRWKVSRKQINVSVDVWNFEPISMDTIAAIIKEGPKESVISLSQDLEIDYERESTASFEEGALED